MSKKTTPIKLTGKKSELLTEAWILDEEIKKKQTDLGKIKSKLDLAKGTYFNNINHKVTVSVTPKLSDPDPKRVQALLKRMKLASKFFGVLKVKVTELKALVGDHAVSKLREDLGATCTKYTFK